MVVSPKAPYTEGASTFSPDTFITKWATGELGSPQDHDLESGIRKAFALPASDKYIYHALVSVTLAQVQHAVSFGGQHGLHAWYRDADAKEAPAPPLPDINAYTSIFSSTTSTSKALLGFSSNAKKSSHRARIAAHLLSKRHFPSSITVPKLKTPHTNPYLDFWAWSCRELEWAGPDAGTETTRQSHHILPVFYHHFGCVCPTFEALHTIIELAGKRAVVELGSGNGYWTYMLRRLGAETVAVDNGDSLWRTMWIGDTIQADGGKYLKQHNGKVDALLLLVYPQATTEFTRDVLKGYKGRTIAIAGTQNRNGYTGFKDVTVEEWLEREMAGVWEKIVQTPLPSFAGKDEALFVFERISLASDGTT